MKCIVLDDESMALNIIKEYIESVPSLELIGTFRSSLKAMAFLQSNDVDLVFLDINMPGLTGLQFLKSITKRPLIIFTTAYSQYAAESYEFEAVDYLLKPIEFERFLKAVNRAKDNFESHFQLISNSRKSQNEKPDKNFIFIKSGNETYSITLNEIQYIEGTGNYITIVLEKKKIMSLIKLKEIENMLPRQDFSRIHKSFIISIKHITAITSHQVKINDKSFPIGNFYRDDFLKKINQT